MLTIFFHPDEIHSFIVFLFGELLVILLQYICWQQILLVFSHWRTSLFPICPWNIIFTGYRILDWSFFSFSTWNLFATSFWRPWFLMINLLSFKLFPLKSRVSFSLAVFKLFVFSFHNYVDFFELSWLLFSFLKMCVYVSCKPLGSFQPLFVAVPFLALSFFPLLEVW